MKIAVTGKGGVGKTTFAATLARLYADEGKKVLAADVDPDANLGLALGFDEETLDSIVPISKMRKLIEERTGANSQNQFYKLNPKVDDIPDTYGKTCNGVKLLVLGTVETGGGGCVCPEHVMLKRVINNLVIHRGDVVIMDMEAGLEHLGRGTTESMDEFIVVKVSFPSLSVACSSITVSASRITFPSVPVISSLAQRANTAPSSTRSESFSFFTTCTSAFWRLFCQSAE